MKKQTVFFVIFLIFFIGNSFPQNNVCVLKGSHNNAFTKVKAPSIYLDRNSLGKVATSSFVVDYIYPQPPASAQLAINYAVDIWSYLIALSKPVKIKVSYIYEAGGVLGQTSVNQFRNNYSGLPMADRQYPISLAKNLDNNITFTDYDIIMEFNGNKSLIKV